MADKVKVGILLAGGCAGCEMALVDLSERLVDALDALEIVFWAPTAADVKYKDLEAMPDDFIDVGFVDGMVRNSENKHTVEVLRKKSKVLIGYGACAGLGGIAAMGDLHTQEELFNTAYKDSWSTDNPDGVMPTPEYTLEGKYDLTIPSFTDRVYTVDELVDVDYFVGGCPPHHEHVMKAIELLLSGQLPAKGSWLTGGKAVCDVCKRNPAETGETRRPVGKVYRMIDGQPDPDKCLLQQGYICFGPITQGDCGSACLSANVPCRGCGGPLPGVKDYGARCLQTIASALADDASTEELMAKYPQLAKFVYRYSYTTGKIDRKTPAA
ncbi:F420-nonreducing hydrogenase [Desulfohalovibrio reitneri]|uniref:NADH-quinone oxidoreductase subunit B family protein n=1 Tax=Desulfohalovibrio reitneri TaxID=1307759 RepID=UPI0004A6F9AA|nr:F420-nonreducing hydrogenase [Desulfohalovibrio reitneri]